MNKKGGAEISVVILVLMTLLLVISSLFYFSIKENQASENLYSSTFLGPIYSKEVLINFYVQNLVDKSAVGVLTREQFINNFKENLANYKDSKGEFFLSEFNQIEGQLSEERVEINADFVSIIFDIHITNEIIKDEKSIALANYDYSRVFEGKLQ
jgi:hypothetical protein